MSCPLAGKVALVTGAARGIGRATALKLARAGCDVVANYYHSGEEAETLCAEIRALGRKAAGGGGVKRRIDHLGHSRARATRGLRRPSLDARSRNEPRLLFLGRVCQSKIRYR